EFGGKDVTGETRKIGVVTDGSIKQELFAQQLQRYGGKVAATGELPGDDPEAVQAAAPTIVTRLKSAGVTTVVPFTGAANVQALMENASKQNYSPEWFFTGASYQDIGLLARNYPPEQAQHAFGISFINPSLKQDQNNLPNTDVVKWYWGNGRG